MRKTPFLHEFVRKRKLAREADAAEQLRLRRQHAGEQKEPFEQLLFACEGHGQQAGTEQNAIGEVDGRSIRQDDLDSAGGGFGFEFDNATDDGVMPALLDRDRRVGDHSFEPADQVALLDGEFAADANGADPVHEVDGLTFLQSEEGLYVTAAEERNGFGRMSLRQDFRKLIDIGRVIGHGGESVREYSAFAMVLHDRAVLTPF